MRLTPTSDQIESKKFLLARKKAGDFSKPGTGKTLVSLMAAAEAGGPVLIIGPPISLRMWDREAADVLNTSRVHGIRPGAKKLDLRGMDVVSVSYHALTAATRERLKSFNPRTVILDEADALKNIKAKRTEAVYGTGARMRGCVAENAEYVFALTGTPIRRYADDVFPHLKALAPDLLDRLGAKSYDAFLKQFCVVQMKSYHPRQRPTPTVIANKNERLLARLMAEIATSREYKDMPPFTMTDLEIGYTSTAELVAATLRMDDIEHDTGPNATVRRLLGLAKVSHVVPELHELHQRVQRPLLCLFWFRDVGQAYRIALSALGYKVAVLDGLTSQKDKLLLEDRFNAGELDFLLGQTGAMGVSLNLQRGSNYGAFLEHDWSHATEEQAYKRLWRMGQQDHVHFWRFIADHPADQAAITSMAGKLIGATRILKDVSL